MSLVTYRIDRDGAERLLFLFHGWSAEQHHLAAYVPLVDPDERYTAICPRAHLTTSPRATAHRGTTAPRPGRWSSSFHDAAARRRRLS